ncbi:regulatory protein RecX [Streptococcus pneumoniae]|nr:regulatory protein RecX [Streptococcus pneumoniae]
MKITKLEKKKRLYLMELDNGDKCYITEDTIVRFMLSRDKVISEEELKEIQDFAQILKKRSGLMIASTLMLSSMPINFQETRDLMY